ncbi:phosphoribosylglycinamide formyltransferase [Caloramator proteoclasticus]|uniref:Phosphoribosylglycinamide formyltransferase n=1 Tax=Caloramator proteoclasticus DSM 10124 TaxID=1121262 RepID=A0A1M4W015_9CLOT|nr:phosphoribosylglycinamide formyltransferase [Caloramator proteoclasticus]SHE74546.1 phosphoribosylglycinamide formyltransferase-1 [Caloramator proteoclasticus DSM 10124]
MFNIAVLISGSGTNLESILNAVEKDEIKSKVVLVIADRECYGIERAKKRGIETYILDRKAYRDELSDSIYELVKDKADFIVLAGFLSILKGDILKGYKDRIINLHPSLLPKFGGVGMYGDNVHRAVLENREKITGCTVHFVDEGVDTGRIILQRTVSVDYEDKIEDIKRKVQREEHIAIVEAIKKLEVAYEGINQCI